MRSLFKIWLPVFIIWATYRFFFHFPEWIDEFFIKPAVFIFLPLKLSHFKTIPGFEKKKAVFEDILIGIAVGIVFAISAILANQAKYGKLTVSPIIPINNITIFLYLALSLATSASEEILGRGFFFNLLRKKYNLLLAAFFSGLLSLSLHLPIIFNQVNPLKGLVLLTFLTSVLLLSIVNSYIYQSRESLVLPILIHLFWNMSVALYI